MWADPSSGVTKNRAFQGEDFPKTPLECLHVYRKPEFFGLSCLFAFIFCMQHLFMQPYFLSNSEWTADITKIVLINSSRSTKCLQMYICSPITLRHQLAFSCVRLLIGQHVRMRLGVISSPLALLWTLPDSLHMWLDIDKVILCYFCLKRCLKNVFLTIPTHLWKGPKLEFKALVI